ncbi:serine hydrolase [Francisella sp. Scap27]|uniref:serine hydrolase n=1 Tax=Francisella sp. Scap27 TaxID=2589986 RepID=UPI0015BB444F|nr:serine hydrolase [Francisella sp. Scap27]QLE79010.1 serine hydrolase [Francisella sp. Scap27]
MQFQELEKIINHDIDYGFSGIAVNICHHGENIYQKSHGFSYKYDKCGQKLDSPQALKEDMLFDIASLTKIFATTYALMYLYERNLVDLDLPIDGYISNFKFEGTNYIPTCRDLLNHKSGLAPAFNFYDENEAGELFSQDRGKTVKFLTTKMKPQHSANKYCIYSDIGMKILGCVIETITNQRLDKFVEQHIYEKLDLKNTCFDPLDNGYKSNEIVATQLDGHTNLGNTKFANIKTHTLRGEVHDEKALYSMGRVAGHAGLFSTIDDISKLSKLLFEDNELFSQKTVARFSEQCAIDKTFALGFWTANGRRTRNSFGELCSNQTIGHTGFTGQCFIFDPVNKISIVIMTNSVHSPIIYPRVFSGKTFQSGKYAYLIDSIYKDLKVGTKS